MSRNPIPNPMKSDAQARMDDAIPTTQIAGWTLHEYREVGSTNDVAAELPAWHAVRASSQSGGRGRWKRTWVSDRGGLWISAVLPVSGDPQRWEALPLAVGLAVAELVASMGVLGVRLRWPNDLLARDRKLAGLLIERVKPGLAVVGIGVNVANHPETRDGSLAGTIARLEELAKPSPTLNQLCQRLLEGLRRIHAEMDSHGFPVLLSRINSLWELPRCVELELGGKSVVGWFEGVDGVGRLGLRRGELVDWYDPAQVVQLRDIQAPF